MEKTQKYLFTELEKNTFLKCVFSSPMLKTSELKNVNLACLKNPHEIKVEYRYQKHNDIKTMTKEFFIKSELPELLKKFKQCFIESRDVKSQILINKKGKSKIITKEKEGSEKKKNHSHKVKNYLIADGERCSFLIEIGVMDYKGRVKSQYYKKFKQINRFLEMVDDLYKHEESEMFHIVDFGCGKSYLTFALYYYFSEIKKTKVKITGIDLKQEVIDHCNEIAKKLQYNGLQFVHGFIHDFKYDLPVDFVVTLHACDTATDDAILFSLKHQAKKMIFVPCCQHELNKQITHKHSQAMLKYGIFKDRMTALITDSMRAQLLEVCGFKVQVMEFIDLEHTAKNIALRCTFINRNTRDQQKKIETYNHFKKEWGITPYLEKKLREDKFIL